MRAARASETFPGSVHEAEACWYDTSRWHVWVDGLERVLSVEGNWPRAGSIVSWESNPAGRGHVTERVVSYQELHGLTAEVEDDSITGRQTVSFSPSTAGVTVELVLEYELKRRTAFSALIDPLFIRRAITTSLATTLARFGAELTERCSGARD